jgi:peptide/nickel transport system permease protein
VIAVVQSTSERGAGQRTQPWLEVEGLTVRLPQVHGDVSVVSKVSFRIGIGEHVGLVGESGCGKTLTALAIMGLLPRGVEATGSVRWRGSELLSMNARERRSLMGREIAMVYQDALLSLNPGMTVRAQIGQLLRLSNDTRTVPELLREVYLPDPEATARAYPFQLSGGQRQRVVIAMALARRPQLLIADEPTTALDETVQAQIIDLLRTRQGELGFSMLMLTHNIALVRQLCDRILVMYAGQLVEEGPPERLLAEPRHPYTKGLVDSVVSLEKQARPASSIAGVVPTPRHFPSGCRFVDRCERAGPECRAEAPELVDSGAARRLACFHPVGTGG